MLRTLYFQINDVNYTTRLNSFASYTRHEDFCVISTEMTNDELHEFLGEDNQRLTWLNETFEKIGLIRSVIHQHIGRGERKVPPPPPPPQARCIKEGTMPEDPVNANEDYSKTIESYHAKVRDFNEHENNDNYSGVMATHFRNES